MWRDALAVIQNEFHKCLRKPATDADIEWLQEQSCFRWEGFALPDGYIEFLKRNNGLDFNGTVIYGVDKQHESVEESSAGLLETNEIWYENEWQKRYIFFGDSSIAWYCYDRIERSYIELDKPSGSFIQSYECFDAMLDDALETTLL